VTGRAGVLSVSIVIPTVGRPGPLNSCLQSIAACVPGAAEVLVVDQSHDPEVACVVDAFAPIGARVVPCAGRGVAKGRNDGIRAAAHGVVLVTDDDCTVQPNWVETALRLHEERPRAIVTGRVLPVGDPRGVPSTKEATEPHDFTGERHGGSLFPNNMVLPRDLVLAAGAFDERFGPDEAAEDNDFSYRWLRAGETIVFEPALVVSHHDWRSPEELEQLYVRYARGQGFLYAKHLRQRDLLMLRWIARDLAWAARGALSAVVKRRRRWTDPRRGILRGMPGGFVAGWRAHGRAVR
jgi:GT2 family glycosyltransferase